MVSPKTTRFSARTSAAVGVVALNDTSQLSLPDVSQSLKHTWSPASTRSSTCPRSSADVSAAGRVAHTDDAQLTKSESELRSLNAELHAVNNQLQSKLEELTHTNSQLTRLKRKTEQHNIS